MWHFFGTKAWPILRTNLDNKKCQGLNWSRVKLKGPYWVLAVHFFFFKKKKQQNEPPVELYQQQTSNHQMLQFIFLKFFRSYSMANINSFIKGKETVVLTKFYDKILRHRAIAQLRTTKFLAFLTSPLIYHIEYRGG